MAVFIGRRPETGFTRVPNEWARDPKLSTKGKGLLTYLLSHEDGYQLSMKQVIAENADGRDSIYKTFAELTDRGYVRRVQRRGERGKVGEVDFYVVDAPVTTASGFPVSGFPGSGDDQGKQDVSAGETAYWNSVSGKAVSGKPATKKTRVLEDQDLEDQNTISLSGSANEPTAEPGPTFNPEPERENEEASQDSKPNNPIHRLLLDAGCPQHQLDDVHHELTLRFQPRSPAWWRRVAKEGDLPGHVAEVLDALRPAIRTMTNTEWKTAVVGEALCPCGEPGGDLPRPGDGWMHCPQCRRQSGWTTQDAQPRTEGWTNTGKRSTGALRSEQALSVADELDREFGHGVYAGQVRSPADQRIAAAGPLYAKCKAQEDAGLDEYGNGSRRGGTRHRLTDSRAPNRDYSENF